VYQVFEVVIPLTVSRKPQISQRLRGSGPRPRKAEGICLLSSHRISIVIDGLARHALSPPHIWCRPSGGLGPQAA